MRKSIRKESFQSEAVFKNDGGIDSAKLRKIELIEETSIAFMLLLCFGTIVTLYMKIQVSEFAPSWAPALYMIPFLYALYTLIRKPIPYFGILLACVPLTIFCVWVLLSFKWSNQPGLSLKQGILFLITYLIAISISINFSVERIIRIFVMIFAFQAIISSLLAIFMPHLGVMTEVYPGAWCGLWGFKQSLGISMSFGIAFTFGYIVCYKKTNPFLFFVLLLMLLNVYKSEATTSVIISLLIFCLCIALYIARLHLSLTLFSLWGVISVVVIGFLSLTVFKEAVFASLGKNPNLTGRTEIWASLQQYIDQRPILGWGFQAFWTDQSTYSPVFNIEAEMNGFKPPDAHSTPKDVLLQLGLIGFIIWCVMLVQTWLTSIFLFIKNNNIFVFICFLIAWTATCFTEALSLYPMEFMTLTFMVIIIKIFNEATDLISK